ncbi:MAG TPA: hypothetical protein DEO49_08780 [Sutterella sp.]|nr:hypothetical protein [Sutterella sp.]
MTPIVDCNLGKEAVGELETEANKAAQEFCAPKELIEEFLASSQGRILEQDVVEFAEQHSIPPAVFAGQIRHKLQKYNMLTKLLSKYRADILNVAPVVDGWGYMRA